MSQQASYLRVPYGMTVHGEEEIEAVVNVLRTSTQMGPNVKKMESGIADLFGQKAGVMVNSGSSALMLGLEVLDLPKGSEVITPALTFSTTVSYIVRNGLIPAFIDVAEGTYLIDYDKIEEMITDKTRAMVIPHLIGNVLDMPRLGQIATKYGLKIVEDSADTLGATINGERTGKWADVSITSFYGSHVINCAGNGGMLCLRTDEAADRAKLLRSWGRSSSLFVDSEDVEARFNVSLDNIPYDAKFVFEAVGHNLEPSEMGAAFGLVQLAKLQDNIDRRIKNFDRQFEFFSRYEKWFVLPRQTPGTRTGWLAFPLTLKPSAPFTRRDLQIFLEKRNIQTRVIFAGNITRQPGFRDVPMKKAEAGYPEADKVMAGGVLLACHHGLTDMMLDHVHESFDAFASQF